MNQSAEDSNVIPTPGYKGSYLKYSFDDVITIVKSVQETTLPATIQPASHPLSMTVAPNLDLLQRQRTFSIDETREQLRQGRPVQQEAISSASSADYGSMMYGDGYHGDAGKASAAGEQSGAAAAGKAAKDTGAAKKAGSTGSWAALVMSTSASPTPAAASASGQNATGFPTGAVVATTNDKTGASANTAKPVAPAASVAAVAAASPATSGDSSWKRGDRVTEKPAEKGARVGGPAAATAAAPTTTGASDATGAKGKKDAAVAAPSVDKERRKTGDKGSKRDGKVILHFFGKSMCA